MIKWLIWTIWTAMSSVPKKADKLNLSLSLSYLVQPLTLVGVRTLLIIGVLCSFCRIQWHFEIYEHTDWLASWTRPAEGSHLLNIFCKYIGEIQPRYEQISMYNLPWASLSVKTSIYYGDWSLCPARCSASSDHSGYFFSEAGKDTLNGHSRGQ